jgi:hypothetical protein
MSKKQDWRRAAKNSLDGMDEEIPKKEIFKNRAKKKSLKKHRREDKE